MVDFFSRTIPKVGVFLFFPVQLCDAVKTGWNSWHTITQTGSESPAQDGVAHIQGILASVFHSRRKLQRHLIHLYLCQSFKPYVRIFFIHLLHSKYTTITIACPVQLSCVHQKCLSRCVYFVLTVGLSLGGVYKMFTLMDWGWAKTGIFGLRGAVGPFAAKRCHLSDREAIWKTVSFWQVESPLTSTSTSAFKICFKRAY